MSFDAGTIFGRLKLDKGSFSSEILNASAITQAFGGTISSFIANPIAGAIQLAKQLGAAIWESLRRTADAADAAAKTAQAVGTTTEFYSGLAHAAKYGGAAAAQLNVSLKFLNKTLNDAASGNAAAIQRFRQAGIAFQDAEGSARPLAAIIYDMADALAAEADESARAYKATLLLGEEGGRLVPTLKDGRRALEDMIRYAHATGNAFTAAGGQIGEDFNDALSRTKDELGGLFQAVELDVLRDLADALKVINTTLREIGLSISDIVPFVSPGAAVPRIVAALRGQSREDLSRDIDDWAAASRQRRVDATRGDERLGRAIGAEAARSQDRQARQTATAVRRRLDRDDWVRTMTLM